MKKKTKNNLLHEDGTPVSEEEIEKEVEKQSEIMSLNGRIIYDRNKKAWYYRPYYYDDAT